MSRFCGAHKNTATINGFLSKLYSNMHSRVQGKTAHDRGRWKGKSIMPKDVFLVWAKNHSDFLALYKRYAQAKFDRRLAPSVNRMDSKKGYSLDNIEWVTNSQNCALASVSRRNNNKEKIVIYKMLGINL